MKQIVIARTELSVSRLSFGTASLHHLLTRRARQRLLSHVGELGFSHFDTAPLYGAGLAEEELGRFLAGRRRSFSVATKIGLYPPRGGRASVAWSWTKRALGLPLRLSKPIVDASIASAEHSLHRSLRRLRREYVDVLFLHEPDPRLVDADEVRRWLERQRALGKLRYHGLAGDAASFLPWVVDDHALCQVLQVRDSLTLRQADAVLGVGRELQFAFGYLSARGAAARPVRERSTPGGGPISVVPERVRAALPRVGSGSVLVSCRKLEHAAELCAAASEARR